MLVRRSLAALLGAGTLVGVLFSCTTRSNYLLPDGPRFAGNYVQPVAVGSGEPSRAEAPAKTGRDAPPPVAAAPDDTLKVVSYNVRYGAAIDEAIRVLTDTAELADADLVLLQEMDAEGVDRIARALGCSYVYYPACLRTSGRDFGNAVLARGRLFDDEKVVLPHVNPFNRQHRIAVGSAVELGELALRAYSIHTETPFLSVESRGEQIETLLASLPASGACLVAGDFNTMGTRSLRRFDGAFAGAGFTRATDDVGETFAIGPFGYALDHVFVRGLEVVAAGKIEDADASDHLPVWVELAPAPNEGLRSAE